MITILLHVPPPPVFRPSYGPAEKKKSGSPSTLTIGWLMWYVFTFDLELFIFHFPKNLQSRCNLEQDLRKNDPVLIFFWALQIFLELCFLGALKRKKYCQWLHFLRLKISSRALLTPQGASEMINIFYWKYNYRGIILFTYLQAMPSKIF